MAQQVITHVIKQRHICCSYTPLCHCFSPAGPYSWKEGVQSFCHNQGDVIEWPNKIRWRSVNFCPLINCENLLAVRNVLLFIKCSKTHLRCTWYRTQNKDTKHLVQQHNLLQCTWTTTTTVCNFFISLHMIFHLSHGHQHQTSVRSS